jgi:hypothetical protein
MGGRARTWTTAAMLALGAATALALSPLVAGAAAGGTSMAVVDLRPGDGRPDDARHAGTDLVVVVPPAACDRSTTIPRTCAALAGLPHTDRDLGYRASVLTALVVGLLSAVGLVIALLRFGGRPAAPATVPEESAALPDDVLAAIPQRVTAVSDFGPKGGFVDAGGLLVWAALIRPGEPVHPGRPLTVLSSSHERDSLLVTLSVPQAARR